jgi:N-acetylmuramoyl-L-alanine amidase
MMKKPEYRQKIAEALYRGVSLYASGLSHFQVARKGSAE